MLKGKWEITYVPLLDGFYVRRPSPDSPGGYEYYRDILFADVGTAQAVADELNEEGTGNG